MRSPPASPALAQVAAASLAGTQYDISFTGGGGEPDLHRDQRHRHARQRGLTRELGVVASGSYAPGADVAFAGIDIKLNGTPAAGDSFAVKPGATSSLFQTVQDMISALQMPQGTGAQATLAQQALQNVLANLGGAQTSVLSAQATLGYQPCPKSSRCRRRPVRRAPTPRLQLSNLQSANLPQVMANYSESLTALQAAQLAFAKVQSLTLFADIHP